MIRVDTDPPCYYDQILLAILTKDQGLTSTTSLISFTLYASYDHTLLDRSMEYDLSLVRLHYTGDPAGKQFRARGDALFVGGFFVARGSVGKLQTRYRLASGAHCSDERWTN